MTVVKGNLLLCTKTFGAYNAISQLAFLASLETQTVFVLVHYFKVSFVLSFICFNLTAKFHASLEKRVHLADTMPSDN